MIRRLVLVVVLALVAGLAPASTGPHDVAVALAADPSPAAEPSPPPSAPPTATPDPTPTPTPDPSSPVPTATPDPSPSAPPPSPSDPPATATPPPTAVPPGPGAVATVTFIYNPSNPIVNVPTVVQAFANPTPDGGTFTLEVDGVAVVTVPKSGSVFTDLPWTPSATGPVTLTVTFDGTAAYFPSTSAPSAVTVIPPYPTSVSVSASPNPVVRNTPAHFSATVTPDPGPGTVEFLVGGDVVGSGSLSGGTATYDGPVATVGRQSLAARFTGNASWSPRTSDWGPQLDVLGDVVTIDLQVASDPLPTGPATATVTLSPDPGGGTLWWGWYSYSQPNQVPVGPGGVTTLDLGTLYAGWNTLYVHFSGNGTWGAADAQLSFTVKYPTTVALATSRTSVVRGELPVVLTAALGPEVESGATVTFIDDVGGVIVELGPVTVDPYSKTASLSSNQLRVGSHSIRARFGGSSWHLAATSDPVAVTVAADTAVHATFKPSTSLVYAYKDGYRDTVSLGGVLDERATVTIKVYAGTRVKRTWSLGTRNPGAFGVTWNGKTASGTKVAAGKYTAKAFLKDALGHTRTITGYVTVSWRQAVWKDGTAVTRYGDQLSYYGTEGSHLYYSGDYGRGRIMDAGEMWRDCDQASCVEIFGTTGFQLKTGVLDHRRIAVQVVGHGFTDREHPGTAYVLNPATGAWVMTTSLPEYLEPGVTYNILVSKSLLSSTKQARVYLYCTEMWGDAFDVHYLRLTYQYAVWK